MDEKVPERVRDKLVQIFTGVYGDGDIPFSTPPPKRVREDEKPLSTKKGIIAWSD